METQARIDTLKKHLKIIETLLQKNPEWNRTQQSIAKYTFCATMVQTTDEITYQIAMMAGRDIVVELRDSIKVLTESLAGPKAQDTDVDK